MLLILPLLSLLVVVNTWFDALLNETNLGLISRRNQARKHATIAYRQHRYTDALADYQLLISSDSSTALAGEHINLGHVYYRLGQFKKAGDEYKKTTVNATPELTSIALTQLGLLTTQTRDTVSALGHFQKALINDPDNEVARHNYELIKLCFSGKNPATKQKQSASKPAKSQVSVGQRTQPTDQQQDRLTRLPAGSLSDEEAQRLLDALQADDLPYALARRKFRKMQPGQQAGRW